MKPGSADEASRYVHELGQRCDAAEARVVDLEALLSQKELTREALETRAKVAEDLVRRYQSVIRGGSMRTQTSLEPTQPLAANDAEGIDAVIGEVLAPVASLSPAEKRKVRDQAKARLSETLGLSSSDFTTSAAPTKASRRRKGTPSKSRKKPSAAATRTFGIPMALRTPASVKPTRSVNPKMKSAIVAAVRGRPGQSWEEIRERIGLNKSVWFNKACNELIAEGSCTIIDNKVHAA